MHQMHFSVIKVKTNSVSCKYVKLSCLMILTKKNSYRFTVQSLLINSVGKC